MSRLLIACSVALWSLPLAVSGQQAGGGGGTPSAVRAPQEARQFDFLIGQWRLQVKPLVNGLAAKIHGAPKMQGTWKAWRAMEGWGIEDEVRIVDASGNPRALSHAIRLYDATARQWSQVVADAYKGQFTNATALWQGAEMVLTGRGTDGEGKAFVSKTRFFDITPTTFKYRNDRSYDQGKTWTEGVLSIEATRTAAEATR